MTKAFIAPKIFTGHELLTHSAVIVSDGKVSSIVNEDNVPPGTEIHYSTADLLAPAFVDIQIYGGNGKLFSTEPEPTSLDATYAYCLSGGCTRFMITMATNSMEAFYKGIDAVREYQKKGGAGLLGLHLEGPYINPIKKGAHIERYIKKPTRNEVEELLTKGGDVIKMMTLAPEQCDPSIIEYLIKKGVLVSAGHSNATYDEASKGFYGGIPAATHLFNAMSPLQGREPGMVGAIYDNPDVISSVVCDGIHVDFASVRISKKILGERLFFITDAVAAVDHGDYPHVFTGDRYTLPNGTLSGSALTMLQCVRNGVEKVGIPLHEALRMASLYPAKLLGIEGKIGSIKKGAAADFVLLDEVLNLVETIVAGKKHELF